MNLINQFLNPRRSCTQHDSRPTCGEVDPFAPIECWRVNVGSSFSSRSTLIRVGDEEVSKGAAYISRCNLVGIFGRF